MSATDHWHAGCNAPGFLPEDGPGTYASFVEARDTIAEDMAVHADNEASWADEHDCDDVPCPTYGDGCHAQRAGTIALTRDELLDAPGPRWSGYGGSLAYWIEACSSSACDE